VENNLREKAAGAFNVANGLQDNDVRRIGGREAKRVEQPLEASSSCQTVIVGRFGRSRGRTRSRDWLDKSQKVSGGIATGSEVVASGACSRCLEWWAGKRDKGYLQSKR